MESREMRISCPNCATDYDVPDAALAGRSRKLLCERCGHRWRNEFVPEPVLPPADESRSGAWEPPPWPAPAATSLTTPPPVIDMDATLMPGIYRAPAPAMPSRDIAARETEPVWQPVAAAPVSWPPPVDPVTPAALDDMDELPPPRRFGKPVDEAAETEMMQAAAAEIAPPPADANELPAFLNQAQDKLAGTETAEDPEPGADRFADLVYAARSKGLELEEGPKPETGVRTSNTPMVVVLVVLLAAGFTVLERKTVEQYVPASTPLFHTLHLY